MRNRIWLSTCPTLGHGRAATIVLLGEMVAQNARVAGLRHPPPMGRGFTGTCDGTNGPAPSMGRAKARNPGPHPHVVDPHSDFHILGLSDCVGAGVISLTYPIQQTVMGPISGHEVLGSASSTD